MSNNRDRNDGHIIEADLREKQEERREEGEAAPHPVLQYIDDEEGRWAVSKLIKAMNIDDELPNFDGSNTHQAIAESSGGQATYNTLEDENVGRASYMKGKSDRSLDLPQTYSIILDELSKDSSVIMIRGSPGTGKTTKAIDSGYKALQFGILDKVMLNIMPENPEELENWIQEERLSQILEFSQMDGEKLLIFDEVSRNLNRKAGNKDIGYDVEELLGNLLPALRKNKNGNLKVMFVVHRDEKDLVKVARKYTNLLIHSYDRDNKNKAYIYQDHPQDSIKYAHERFEKGKEPDFHSTGFQDIDHPYLKIDTNSSAQLDLDIDDIDKSKYPEIFNAIEEDDSNKSKGRGGDSQSRNEGVKIEFPDDIETRTEKINYLYHTLDLTQEETADELGVSRRTVSNHLN